jgi:Phage integrase family
MDGDAFDRLVFQRALAKAKIQGLCWKDLRHTVATRLRMHGGADVKSIAELLGHTSTRMTERYAHASQGHLHALVQGISRVTTPVAPSATRSATGDASALEEPKRRVATPRQSR